MSKKFEFNFVPFDHEAVQAMTNDDLHFNMRKYKRMIREAKSRGKDSTYMEIEYCYLDQENQRRERFSGRRYNVR